HLGPGTCPQAGHMRVEPLQEGLDEITVCPVIGHDAMSPRQFYPRSTGPRSREPGLHRALWLTHPLHRVTETVQIPLQQIHRPTVVPARSRRHPVTAGYHLDGEIHQYRGGATEHVRSQSTIR